MPRKRKKRVIQGSESVTAPVLSLQDDEGFYPYRLTYEVVDKQDNLTRVFLGPVPSNHADGAKDTVGVRQQTFHHLYSAKYPELCQEFAILAATHSISTRHTISAVRTCLWAITVFFEFIESECKKLTSFRDICTDVMVEYRAYIRSQSISESSQYKSTCYNPIKSMLNRAMGTSRGPESFDIPIYQVDSADADL